MVSNHPDAGTSGLNGSFSKYQEQDFESVLMMAIAYDEPWLDGDPAQSMVPGPGHPNLGFDGFLKLSWGARICSVGVSIYDIRPTYH